MEKVINILVIIGILLIFLGIIFALAWKLDEQRCWNMPLNSFYNDPLCVQHTWTYEEMNRR